MADTLEADLESAITEELEQPINDLNQLAGAGATPRVRPFRVKDIPKEEKRQDRGSDQLALAVSGLLMIEEEFLKLAQEIVGELEINPKDHEGKPSESGAVLPRLRTDAELLARLAIRFHNHFEQVRSKL